MLTLILSDIHLGSRHSYVDQLSDLLDKNLFDQLILVGDTLHSVNMKKLSKRDWQLLTKLHRIARTRSLVLIRGNHDHEHVDENYWGLMNTRWVLPSLLEIPMIESFSLRSGGKRYLVIHGDQFDPLIRYPIATELAEQIYRWSSYIHPLIGEFLKKRTKVFGQFITGIRNRATAYASNTDHDGVIMGHTHHAEDVMIDKVRYMNTGSWTERPCSYIVADDKSVTLHFAE